MYELHNLLRYILLFFYSFWIPQIVANVVRDSRKPLHPHYILGITVTRLAIPLYAFGCPKNFMRIETNVWWCLGLTAFLGAQAGVLLLQHYFGARCFVPRQVRPFEFVRCRTLSQIWLDPLWKNFQMFNFPTYGIQMLGWGWLIYNLDLRMPLLHVERLRAQRLRVWRNLLIGGDPLTHAQILVTLELSTWELELFTGFTMLRWHIDDSHVQPLQLALVHFWHAFGQNRKLLHSLGMSRVIALILWAQSLWVMNQHSLACREQFTTSSIEST